MAINSDRGLSVTIKVLQFGFQQHRDEQGTTPITLPTQYNTAMAWLVTGYSLAVQTPSSPPTGFKDQPELPPPCTPP